MTTLRASAMPPTRVMRSAGDFDAMWREMAQTDAQVWTLAHQPLPGLYTHWEPRIDFVEQDDAYLLRAELPGMQRDDLTIVCHDRLLTVRGEQTISAPADRGVPRTKHGYRAFARRFVLAEAVDADAMDVAYTHGVLEVCLPKAVAGSDQQSPVQVLS